MRTATITFHAPNNNGSFLQAYALQKYLTKHYPEIENQIIDFQPPAQLHQYAVIRKVRSKGDLMRNIISLCHYKGLSERARTFAEMREKHLSLTRRCTTVQDVLEVANEYDTVIAGSDQIWNTAARDFSEAFFLPELQKKKVTYAVSCGSHLEAVDSVKIKQAVETFDFVSVREKVTKDYLDNEIGTEKSTEIVLDPTLLLSKEDYSELYDSKPIVKGKYIFLYTINYNDDLLRAAQTLGKKLGLQVVTPFTGYSAIKAGKYGIKVLWNVAPNSFLNLINNAEYVCSNSFHGIVFSIIFHKKFFRLGALDEYGQIKKDDRIDSILQLCHLTECNYGNDKIEKFESYNEIDYNDAEQQLHTLKNQSYAFIQKMLFD